MTAFSWDRVVDSWYSAAGLGDNMGWNEQTRITCQFHFKCPQLWDRLFLTNRDGVRHCSECNRDVHLALTQEDFSRHRDEGHCIAVPVLREDGHDESEIPLHLVGMAMPLYEPD